MTGMEAPVAVDKATVWLIEDHEDYREMVAQLINHIDGFTCARSFESCEEALETLSRESAPQIILSDVGLPGMSGIEGIRKIKELSPSTFVVMLTVYDNHEKVFEAICAGASGYLLKNSSQDTVAAALKEVLAGGAPMHPRVAKMVLETFARQNVKVQPQHEDYGLSPREKDILELMVKGFIKKEIADQLGLSPHTVDFYLRKIYEKLHVNTRTGAVAKALKEKLF